MKRIIIILLTVVTVTVAYGQTNENIEKYLINVLGVKPEKINSYMERMYKDTIDGVYIPKDLSDCFVQLDKIFSDKDKREFIENEGNGLYHFGIGMWMRNNWGLWGGSRLQKYFIDKRGFMQPDDMSSYILSYYYYWLIGEHKKWQEWMAK